MKRFYRISEINTSEFLENLEFSLIMIFYKISKTCFFLTSSSCHEHCIKTCFFLTSKSCHEHCMNVATAVTRIQRVNGER